MRERNVLFLLLLFATSMPIMAFGQFEVGGGYSHLSGDGGLDGFRGTVGYQFNRRVALVGEGDFLFDNSKVGVFDLVPDIGTVRIKSNLQNYLGGARVRIIGFKPLNVLEKKKLLPFGEVLVGMSRLSQSVRETQGTVQIDAADKAFTWLLGGGVDYTLTGHWVARANIDFERTHFIDEGQSRLRIGLGLAYAF